MSTREVAITPEEIGTIEGRKQMALLAYSKLPPETRRDLAHLLGQFWNGGDVCNFMPSDASLWPNLIRKALHLDTSGGVPMIVPTDPTAVMRYHAAIHSLSKGVWTLRQEKEGKVVASLGHPVVVEATGKSALEAAFKLLMAPPKRKVRRR
jgi:hypothetical protein